MMLRPPLFLLDEPFGALDPITRHEIHKEFRRLQESEARTSVLVTHDLREALALSQRIVILEDGRVIQHDTCEVVVDNPATEFVADLLSSQLDNT